MKELRANRLHIAFLGKMNTGKSSIINALFNRELSIVSDTKGTTTDVNQKAMELLPLGAVSILDTAGIDDKGELGQKRVSKTYEAINRADVAVFVFDFNGVDEVDIKLFEELKNKKIPILSIINKTDIAEISKKDFEIIKENSKETISLSAKCDKDLRDKIKQALIKILPEDFVNSPKILEGLIEENETAVLVVPIDKEAPKDRLILPQVQTIRNMLDKGAISLVCTPDTLKETLSLLKKPPKIVITDSQAFREVSKIVPEDINLTGFSIIFARLKGDLKTFYEGAGALDSIKDGDKILICESCSHHPIEDDIGTIKIPKLIKNYTGKNVEFKHVSGHIFPNDIENYKLIIHCGACMTNRREVLSRLNMALSKNVAISNYGIIIAKCTGILNRAIKPFNL